MLEDLGIIVVILLAARGAVACRSDLRRWYFSRLPREDDQPHEQVYDGPSYWSGP